MIIFVVVLMRQGTRISRLENELRERKNTDQFVSEHAKTAAGVQSATSYKGPVAPTSSAGGSKSKDSRLGLDEAYSATGVKPPSPASVEVGEESSGKILGGIGIAAVIVGIAFFLKFAFDNNWIDPTGRIILGIIAGLVLLGVGQVLRKKYVGYSDFLMGGGIAVLYLSIYSAHAFYQLVSPETAGFFMFIVTVLGFAISIVNATAALAIISALGGFLTPSMISTGQNNMMALFGYVTILNIGVLAVSFFKKWPALIVIAFAGTVINFLSWFGIFYTPEVLGPTLTFCFISFLIFLLASVARAITGKAKADQLNYFLLGANAFLFAVIGYGLLDRDYHSVLGFAAVFVALIFMAVAFVINKANPEDRALNIFLPGLAVTFLSLAVPLQLHDSWIATAWIIEAVVLYGISSVISNRGFQIMGAVVYTLGLIDLLLWNLPSGYSIDFVPVFNSFFIILVLAIAAAYAISYMYKRYGSTTVELQKRGIVVFVIVANILTVYAISTQITRSYDARLMAIDKEYQEQMTSIQRYNTGNDGYVARENLSNKYSNDRTSATNQANTWVSIFWTIYAALLTAIGFGLRKPSARRMGLALFIITAFKVFVDVWNLGQIYRVVSFIVFGIIALAASFAYAKYKDRLKEIV